MNEREYVRLKTQIESEYRKRIEALEIIWEMARTEAPSKPQSESSRSTADLAPAIKAVLPNVPAEFSIHEIEPKVRETLGEVNRSSLSSALKRLADAKEFEVVEVGIGRKPTRYRKAA